MPLLAGKYMLISQSSVQNWKDFSIGGMICSPKSKRHSAKTSEMLMFLHYNLGIMHISY